MGDKRSRLKLPPKEYALLRLLVFDRDKRRCVICTLRKALHAHHIVFRSNGGPDASGNLVTVCNDCHDALHFRVKPGQGVVILPLKEGEPIDADKGFKLLYVNGWTPKTNIKRR